MPITLFQFTVPSKTFLLGEYLALYGGETLLATTPLRFRMEVAEASSLTISGISANSPAWHFINENFSRSHPIHIGFKDPYKGMGGLGASSAQYLLCYSLGYYLTHKTCLLPTASNIRSIVASYQSHTEKNGSFFPSGADLIAQLTGQICYYHKQTHTCKAYNWPFKTLNFYLFKTNQKIATHRHLQTLGSFSIHPLRSCMNKAISAFKAADALGFAAKVNHYAALLEEAGFVANTTKDLLMDVRSQKGVVAAKGCGAMGADVILVLVENNCQEIVTTWAYENCLTMIGDKSQIARTGLELDVLIMPHKHERHAL